mmetsp:Transcript_3214/g.5357  ORF Transcript_3214/g.5357 Transcript_3214/m.5357 type:complete len:351 (+) Transcript_3214:71-1123(+)
MHMEVVDSRGQGSSLRDSQLFKRQLNPSETTISNSVLTSEKLITGPMSPAPLGQLRFSSDGGNDQWEGEDMKIKLSSNILSPSGDLRRTFFDRTFSKVDKGSLRGSIFSLCAAAIGSGVLSLPYVLRLNGYVLGICFIMTGAIAAVWSNKILANMAVQEKLPNLSRLANKAGGEFLEKSLQWMILIYTFGSCISYEIIITSLFKYIYQQFDSTVDIESKALSAYQAIPTTFILLFPLSMKRDMSAFRYISLASIGALLYTGVVLLVELPAYYKEFSQQSEIVPAYWDLNIFVGCSMTFFAYTCQIQLLPIYSELVNPEKKRIYKVINRAIFVDVAFYMSIAVAGYFSQFD